MFEALSAGPRSALQAQRAAAQGGGAGAGVRIGEIRGRHLTQLTLFGGRAPDIDARVLAAVGIGLPASVNTQTISAHAKIKCLTPRRYWIDAHDAAPAERLLRSLPSASGAMTVLSQSWVRVALEGPKTRDLLAKGISIDVHPEVFRVGDFALTALHHTTVLLERGAGDRYEMWLTRTYAATLWEWLIDAAWPLGFKLNGEDK